jgi:hypothetical protein
LTVHLGRRTDAWWDLEGTGARRRRIRQRIFAFIAFVIAVGACVAVGYGWYRAIVTGSLEFTGSTRYSDAGSAAVAAVTNADTGLAPLFLVAAALVLGVTAYLMTRPATEEPHRPIRRRRR